MTLVSRRTSSSATLATAVGRRRARSTKSVESTATSRVQLGWSQFGTFVLKILGSRRLNTVRDRHRVGGGEEGEKSLQLGGTRSQEAVDFLRGTLLRPLVRTQ